MADDLEIEDILRTEWSPQFQERVLEGYARKRKVNRFIGLCQMAMVVSFRKYGAVADGFGPDRPVDAMETLPEKLGLYVDGGDVKGVRHRPGNTHWLADVHNYAMIEHMLPRSSRVRVRKAPATRRFDRPAQVFDLAAEYAAAPTYGLLVAIGRLAMEEFCSPAHPTAHYLGIDGSNGRSTAEGFSERPNVVSRVRDFR